MYPRILAALACAVVLAAGDAPLDRVILKEKGASDRWIVSESTEEMVWKTGPAAGTENKSKMREVKSVLYAFQRSDSPWQQGVAARERGKAEEAAELFAQMATNGSREAEKVIGSLEEGACWEMAGKWADAGKAFQRVVDGYPKHPRWLDAVYRLGMVYAQGGQKAEAQALIAKLEELAKGAERGQQARVRSFAIQAALFQADGDARKAREFQQKAQFSATDSLDRPSWMHFNLFFADAFRAQGKGKEAAPIYERMLPFLDDDVATRARVKLGVGLSKADDDRQGAIIELLELDVMPFGSPEQKCEARFNAGRLLLDEANATMKDPLAAKDERKTAFAAENQRAARVLLSAAAEATVNIPSKAKAAELLASLPKEETAKAEAPAKAEPAKGEPAKGEAPAKADAAKDAPKAADPKAAPPKADAPKTDAKK